MISSEKIKETLEQDGYIVLKNALKNRTVEALATTVKKIFAAHALAGEDIHKTCVRLGKEDKDLLYRIYQYSQSNLVMDGIRQECFEYAKPLFPEDGIFIALDCHVIVNLPDDQRTNWGWHQESTYHPEVEHSIGFWFPFLEPSTKLNGTMSVLKGSHRMGKLPYTINKPSHDGATTLVPENIGRYQEKFSEEFCLLDPGDLLMFDMDIIHHSNPNVSTQPRFTGLFRIACIKKIPGHFGKIT